MNMPKPVLGNVFTGNSYANLASLVSKRNGVIDANLCTNDAYFYSAVEFAAAALPATKPVDQAACRLYPPTGPAISKISPQR